MLRGEQGERLGVSRFVLGEGLQRVRPWEDWGPGEGVRERGDEGARSVLGCVRGCQDFGEAVGLGAVGLPGEFLRISGYKGLKMSSTSRWRKSVASPHPRRGSGFLGSAGGGVSPAVAGAPLTCRHRSRGKCPARTPPPRGSRTAAARSARAASSRSAGPRSSRSRRPGALAGAPAAGEPTPAAGGLAARSPVFMAGGRGGRLASATQQRAGPSVKCGHAPTLPAAPPTSGPSPARSRSPFPGL